MKKCLVISWLVVLFSTISFLFWHNEWKYSLPTPVPANYQPVKKGSLINVDHWIEKENNKPVFFHFFNPDCPCSRFNIAHFKLLVKQYNKQISFCVVVISNKNYTTKDIRDKFDLSIPILFDRSIATVCGVYSTPQAALIDENNRLYFRGNYNKSRYCTATNSNYAQLAIDSLLQKHIDPVFTFAATKSYGCSLPGCVIPIRN